jgi:hypothetical protein
MAVDGGDEARQLVAHRAPDPLHVHLFRSRESQHGLAADPPLRQIDLCLRRGRRAIRGLAGDRHVPHDRIAVHLIRYDIGS